MKRRFHACLVVLSTLVGFAETGRGGAPSRGGGQVVVANRAGGTISIIDSVTDTVVDTIPLPGTNFAEPMYVVSVGRRVFVGDRANNQVVVFDKRDYSVLDAVPAGEGVFHMWAGGGQLWVVNDVDNTATVIDVDDLSVITTVPMPGDLVALGGSPHDTVVASGREQAAFVSIVGLPGSDVVVRFDTQTFAETARVEAGKDPHLSLYPRRPWLYVPAQNSDVVTVYRRSNLSLVTDMDAPGAHGAGMRGDGRVFYTTNLPGGGPDGLIAVETRTNTVLGAVDTPATVPHNIALNAKGAKIYVTHSGATADLVSVYTTSPGAPLPVLKGTVTVGLNPFGLAFVR